MKINTIPAKSSQHEALLSILQVFGASLFLALCAQISIPLHFSPVPISGQTFGIMLIGATLGSRKGLLSVLTYIMEGAFGLPVFAGGSFGIISVIGTNGGYFLGFLAQVYLIGSFVERQKSFCAPTTLAVLLFSCAIQLALGVLWLSLFVGLQSAMIMGFFPFLLGEVSKVMLVTAYLKMKRS